jgi:glycerophosphoryl diester phosphodiesterase
MIFHDDTLERLIEGRDAVRAHDAATLKSFKYRGDPSPMIDFAELLELVDGREPVLAEIKSDWKPPDLPFLQSIAELASSYRGPIALVSYDPDVIAIVKELVPQIPRGIVSGLYEVLDHWHGRLEQERAFRLSHLLESRDAAPDFYAYHVASLPTPVTRFAREIVGLPFFAWTVRTPEERKIADRWADAPIFENYEP